MHKVFILSGTVALSVITLFTMDYLYTSVRHTAIPGSPLAVTSHEAAGNILHCQVVHQNQRLFNLRSPVVFRYGNGIKMVPASGYVYLESASTRYGFEVLFNYDPSTGTLDSAHPIQIVLCEFVKMYNGEILPQSLSHDVRVDVPLNLFNKWSGKPLPREVIKWMEGFANRLHSNSFFVIDGSILEIQPNR